MTKLASPRETRVSRPLKVLVPLIKHEIELGNKAGLEHYRLAGEMLLEAKEQVGHGDWQQWLTLNFHLSHRTAKNYMKLAELSAPAIKKGTALPFSTLSQAVDPHRPSHHRQAWHEPVRDAVDKVRVDRLAQEQQSRADENKLTRELALNLIDIGYKALVQKLHPDKGGSPEAMTRLNRVRDLLKRAV